MYCNLYSVLEYSINLHECMYLVQTSMAPAQLSRQLQQVIVAFDTR